MPMCDVGYMSLQLAEIMQSGCAESAVQNKLPTIAELYPKLKLREYRLAPYRNAATSRESYEAI